MNVGGRFLKKLEIELPYDPAIPLLGIHTEETRRERDTNVFKSSILRLRILKQRAKWLKEIHQKNAIR